MVVKITFWKIACNARNVPVSTLDETFENVSNNNTRKIIIVQLKFLVQWSSNAYIITVLLTIVLQL